MPKHEAKVIVFNSAGEMPPMPASLATTLYNKTGSWRYMRPVYRERTPPCNEACPAGEDIVIYLGLVADGRFREAWEVLRRENPFPGVCGRVCPHPCESQCNRERLGGAIAIHHVERFLSDWAAAQGIAPVEQKPTRLEKVSVVGAGPAGLACAYHLALKGYPVTVFEADALPGGMLRTGIPAYRLPRNVLDREIAAIQALGVEIRTGQRLGGNLSWEDLADCSAVFLALGQQLSRELGVPGEDAQGVLHGLSFLRRLNLGEQVPIGRRVAVIGGGNTAMDAARSSRRLGAEVTVVYRRSRAEMPAIAEEVQEATDEGIGFHFLAAPVEVLTAGGRVRGLRCVRMQLGEPDASGRRRPEPIPGSEFEMGVDTVIPALGQEADLGGLPAGIACERGAIRIERSGATTWAGAYAGGDVATGFGTVTAAIGSGKRAAIAIHRLLRGEAPEEFPTLDRNMHVAPRPTAPEVVSFEELNLAHLHHEPRPAERHRPAAERLGDFAEANPGLEEETVVGEGRRCFSCGTCNRCDNCLNFCPDISVLRCGEWAQEYPTYPYYEIYYDYCKGCGICAAECPRRAITMEEELLWKR
jgi:NADPH-dependent glutamate synthase beta subunit-like oxidoreductase/Pyruvate/2-oxoacid:ferredoxin oxidoreductase delta subunit